MLLKSARGFGYASRLPTANPSKTFSVSSLHFAQQPEKKSAAPKDLPAKDKLFVQKLEPKGIVSTSSIASVSVIAPPKNPFHVQKRFKTTETTRVPDFSSYEKSGISKDPSQGRALTYVMWGTTGLLGAVGAKNFVIDFLSPLTPAADVLAMAKAEVDLTNIPEGKNVTVKWRGKPVFIRHRTAHEIEEAAGVNVASLRDPQNDLDRVKKPEWLVVLGICTHLGCVPIGEAGDYDGWYCPCHGSHYDISGRIRKGPAPTNLEVPPYEFNEDDTKLIIG